MNKDLNTNYLTKNYKLFLPTIVSVLLICVAIYFGYLQVTNIFAAYETIEKTEVQIESENERLARLKELENGELSNLIDLVQTTLPPEIPVFSSLGIVNTLADENNIVIDELLSSPGSVASSSAEIKANTRSRSKTDNDYETLRMVMTITGKLTDVNAFLKSLLTVSPLLELSTVRIASYADEKSTSEIELNVYWKPEKGSSSTTKKNVENFTSEETELLDRIAGLRRE